MAVSGEDIERSILELLSRRDPGKTICPSDAARAVGGDAWPALMPDVRARARAMVARGELKVTQGGRVVDPATARGAIRLRLPAS